MTTKTTRAAAALTALVLALAGCGGGGGGGDASGQISSTVTAFLKHGDCSLLTPALRKQLTGETDAKACSHYISLRNKVKQVDVGKISVSGDTATAAVTVDGDHVAFRLVKQGGTWLLNAHAGGGSGDASAPAQTTATAPATTTPASGGADTSAARAGYAVQLSKLRTARDSFKTRVLADLRARNLSATTGDFGRYRDALFNFDAAVRKLGVPDAAGDAVNALLEADRTEIADLDAISSASNFAEISRILSTRVQTDDGALTKALHQVSDALTG